MKLSWKQLNEKGLDILKEHFEDEFNCVSEFVNSDLDLEVCYKEGLTLVITDEGLESNDFAMAAEILERVGKSAFEDDDEEHNEHMKLYKKHGLFHDGGDDLDYGGGWVWILADIINATIKGGNK